MHARLLAVLFFAVSLPTHLVQPTTAADLDHALALYTRARSIGDDGRVDFTYKTVHWDARKTAVIVCDMWDKHWCRGATRRVAEMAPRMNQVLEAARAKGALIVHAPSGTMDAYDGTPQRARCQNAPQVETDIPLKRWVPRMPEREGELPIDDADGGCDCDPPCATCRPWTRQIATLEIAAEDAIGDGADVFYLLEARGIENVILLGVHANMCILGRPFGIRQLVLQGKNVVLMRDMTDSMYNSHQEPKVSHVRGTELVIEHIERYWCPTVTSTDLVPGPAFRFEEDTRPHVVIMVSDRMYDADETVPRFGQTLRERCGYDVTVLHGQGKGDIPAMDELDTADCVLLQMRRLALAKPALDRFRAYLASGGALVALRTASHAFDIKRRSPEGYDQWPEFDAEILGGNYHGHGPDGCDVRIERGPGGHPIIEDITPTTWHSSGSLYNTAPVAEDVVVLMTGRRGETVNPVSWVREKEGRVFYTSLGHPDDYREPAFVQLVINAIAWAME